jgi:pimeloyl-ACP methyl ester carboxylesterase
LIWLGQMLIIVLLSLLFIFALLWAHDSYLRRQITAQLPAAGQFIETPRADLHYLKSEADTGAEEQPVFVLIHGSSASCYDVMASMGAALQPFGTVLAFDRPGLGRSRLKVSAEAMAHPGEQADELHLAIAKLGYKNPIIIGHSWGGSVAMAYAQRHGDAMTGAVILAAPLYPWDNKPAWYNRMVTWPLVGRLLTHSVVTKYGLGQLQAGVAATAYPERIFDGYSEKVGLAGVLLPRNFITNAIYSNQLSDHLAKMQHGYGSVTTPLILIGGDRDQTVHTKRNSHRLQETLPQTELIYLRGVGHMLHHTQIDKITDAARRLAKRQVQAGIHEFGQRQAD